MEKLTAQEALMAINQLRVLVTLIATVPVEELIREVEFEDSLGCFFHPTEWQEQRKQRAVLRELVEAARPLHSFARAQAARQEEEEVKS